MGMGSGVSSIYSRVGTGSGSFVGRYVGFVRCYRARQVSPSVPSATTGAAIVAFAVVVVAAAIYISIAVAVAISISVSIAAPSPFLPSSRHARSLARNLAIFIFRIVAEPFMR